MEAKYLDVHGAADYLGVKVRFVRRLVAERRIAFHKPGAHLRFDVADLEEFMQACRFEPITQRTVRRDLRGVA